jgi:aryl-alcohol dehydrogenase-like predicted oxidoreductase
MRYNRLGSTGLFVSELCLGTMTFGARGRSEFLGAVAQAEADAMLARALEAGVNFVDTADIYGDGASEEITGRALRNVGVPRDEVVVATKVFGGTGPKPNQRGLSRAHVLDGLHASLARLRLDHVDLYQVHGFDPATPVEETLRALDDVVRQGLVRYVGVSNWAAWQIAKALGVSARHGLAPFASLQAYYSLAGRDAERELVPLLESEGMGLLVWSPLAGGLLSGKYRPADGAPAGGAPAEGRRQTFAFPPVDADRADRVLAVLRPMAERAGRSAAQLALAWLLARPRVTSVILGARRAEQLADNLGAADVTLGTDDLAALDEASRLPAEYPGWMLDFWGRERAEQLAGSHT